MQPITIDGGKYYLKDLFSEAFTFTIPSFQRPYAWTTKQTGTLFADLREFMEDGETPIDRLSPYFLGSIILVKSDEPEAQLVDGQQRLTTLTILLSALRASVAPETAREMESFFYTRGKLITKTTNHYRLHLRQRDQPFFQRYIQDDGGIVQLATISTDDLSESEERIAANAKYYLERVRQLPEKQRLRLIEYIVNRCLMVVVTSTDLVSAYRVFSIMNSRGLSLKDSDFFKSRIIGALPEARQQEYTAKWEDIEAALGRERFNTLFRHMLRIEQRQQKPGDLLMAFPRWLEEEYIGRQRQDYQHFIIDKLVPYGEAMYTIQNANYGRGESGRQINYLLQYLKQIPNSDWTPPALYAMYQYAGDDARLYRILTELERLAAYLLICGSNDDVRIARYGSVLTALQQGVELDAVTSPLFLTKSERANMLRALNHNFESHSRRLYVLLRLEGLANDLPPSAYTAQVTVEHVLPNKPEKNSQWFAWYQGKHQQFVDRLANLVLLPVGANRSAGNADFAQKRVVYQNVTEQDQPLYALAREVLNEREWTPEVLRKRQEEVVGRLKALWKL